MNVVDTNNPGGLNAAYAEFRLCGIPHNRHTFGTRMAAVGTPIRTLQEWLGHKDLATTQRYVDYAPGTGDADLIAAAFTGTTRGQSEPTSADLSDLSARNHGLSDPR